MAEEMQLFERLLKALAYLSDDDLLSLLKAIRGLMHEKYSDPALRGQIFEARGTFYREPSGQSLALEEMLRLIKALNPAELEVLSTLGPYHFDRTRYADGQEVSATWGTASSLFSHATVVGSSPGDVSEDEMQQRTEQFKTLVNLAIPLLTSAQEAKAAGNDKEASELFEKAADVLKENGISGPMLDYFLSQFQN